ncbi:MAG: MATE family efflux transporter [Muribaculaceae bacterium]|nr:MATE family efflux transporter [Muribaculaceae bacterium]
MEQNFEKSPIDYEHGNIPSVFRKIFFPTLLGMIFNALITIIDGIFVGQGVGPEGIAAVNIIAPLFMITTGIGLMFGIGASVCGGIAIASKDYKRANGMMTSAFIFSTSFIALLIIICALFPYTVAKWLGSSDLLMDKATDYLLFLLIGIIPLMWQSIGMMVIRLDGSPKYAMSCNIVPAVINIILDWWFVFPLGMGVKGAALATSIACFIGGIMAVVYFKFSYILKFTTKISGFMRNVWDQITIGSSAFVTEVAMSIMMFTGNIVFMRAFGENGVASYSISCYLFPLIFMINNAVAQSAQPIISINYGIQDLKRIMTALKVSLVVAAICGSIATIGIALCAHEIVSLFIDPTSKAAEIAISGLPIFALTGIFFALNISFIGFYQSIQKSLRALILTLLRGVIILVPMFFLLSALFPEWGMWAAIPSSEFITLLIILMTFLPQRKSLLKFSL